MLRISNLNLLQRFALALLLVGMLMAMSASAHGAETPRAGGELVFAVGETPPSFDGHRETTFAMLHPIAPHYSTLLRFDLVDHRVGGLARARHAFGRKNDPIVGRFHVLRRERRAVVKLDAFAELERSD